MRVDWASEQLVSYEDGIARLFEQRAIRAPVHLSGGNEEQLISYFRDHVDSQDWVLTTWRSHYHCLLKGVPPEQLTQAILDGRSISLCFPEYRILSSAIVGGTAPIAVGLAMGIKRKGKNRKAHCFLGDMAAESGIVHESMKYAANHELPVKWIIEDNGKSVCTSTKEVWGSEGRLPCGVDAVQYRYTLTRPHVGVGKWVSF